jgi:mono/diheme cytochrome c family protein
MNRRMWEIFLIIIVSVLVFGCTPTEGSAPEATTAIETLEGKAIVETVCTSCHSLSEVTSASYNREEWEITVERMIEKGAKLDSDQKALVIDYLVSTYPKE